MSLIKPWLYFGKRSQAKIPMARLNEPDRYMYVANSIKLMIISYLLYPNLVINLGYHFMAVDKASGLAHSLDKF